MSTGSFFKLTFCTFICLSNNSLISSWISAKFVSALLLCILNLSYYFQSEANISMYLRRAIILQVDSYHNLDPLHMICINFQVVPMQYFYAACICLYFQKVVICKTVRVRVGVSCRCFDFGQFWSGRSGRISDYLSIRHCSNVYNILELVYCSLGVMIR